MSNYFIVIFLYLSLMIFLGFASYRKKSNFAEYIIGNRSLSAFVIGFSYLASEISVGTFTVAVSMIYRSGLSRIWIDVGFLVFTILCWQLIAKPLRINTQKLNAITIPQYFTKRFDSNLLGIITTLVIVFFSTVYIAANLLGFAKIISNIFEIPQFISYGLGFLVIVIYVTAGGFKATCFTDVAQGIIMLLASIILPIILTYKLGIDSLYTALSIKSKIIHNTDFMHSLLYLGFGMCLFGAPHTITRFMAIKSIADISRARNISIALNIVMYAGIAISALYSIVVFEQVSDSEIILFQLSKMFLHPVFGGLIIVAMISAMMSTVDSQLALCSSCLTNDIYKNIRKSADDKELILVTRIITIFVSVIAMTITFFYNDSILKLALFALTGLGTSLGPILLISLYDKNITNLSAIIGVLSGAFLTVLYTCSPDAKDLHYNLLPIFCISTFSIFVSNTK